VDHLGEFDISDIARFGAFTSSEAYPLIFEHIARTWTLRVADAVPEFNGTLHYATTLGEIDFHISVIPRPGVSRPQGRIYFNVSFESTILDSKGLVSYLIFRVNWPLVPLGTLHVCEHVPPQP
jgi:hypothetical protein